VHRPGRACCESLRTCLPGDARPASRSSTSRRPSTRTTSKFDCEPSSEHVP